MSKYPAGYRVIAEGKCPRGLSSPLGCMFCLEGHMLECHKGMDCYEAQCDHLLQETGSQ